MKRILTILLIMTVSLLVITNGEEVFAADGEELDNLSEQQLDEILVEKGYSEKELKDTFLNTKRELAKSGDKAEYTVEMIEKYHSLDGTTYEVTEETKEKVDEIREKDLEAMNINKIGAMNFGGDSEGIWRASTYVSKEGETSSEHEYRFATDWLWTGYPVAQYTDSVATAWETDFTGLANTEDKYSWAMGSYADGDRMIVTDSVNLQSELYGLKGNITIGNWPEQAGGMSQSLRIPKSLNGTTASLVGKYVHPYTNFTVGLNIGPGSITSNKFVGDEWSWRVNVKVGQ